MEPFVLRQAAGRPELLYLDSWMNEYPELSAGFTARSGGTSTEEFDSLNCALHVGDDPSRVAANRKAIAEALDLPFDAWTCAEQVHGKRVHVVTEAERGKGRLAREDAIAEADALITNVRGVWLTAFYADCVPLYFYDPVRQAVALAHAGWKGSVLDVAGETVRAMTDTYGTKPERLRAAIGPSIGPCCYEVDRPVIDHIPFNDTYTPAGSEKYMLDLKHLNRKFMIKAGILPTRIEISALCTSCFPEMFFSHRGSGGKTGRMAAWAAIR